MAKSIRRSRFTLKKARNFSRTISRGLEKLPEADLVIFFTRLLTLPMYERELIVKYIDSGLRVLVKHHVAEGMNACVDYLRNQNPWESQIRTPEQRGPRNAPAAYDAGHEQHVDHGKVVS